MGLMIIAPLLVRYFDRTGLENPARALAWVSYSWMGAIFIAFSLFSLMAVWELLTLIGSRFWPWLTHLSLYGATASGLLLLLVGSACFYGVYEAGHVQIERVRIESGKLPPGSLPLKIALITDLHLGLIHRDEALAPIISRLLDLQPDLLLAGGDIVDAQISHLDSLAKLFERITPPLGKYAVTGNHEVYAGLNQALGFLYHSGFEVLRNRSVDLGPWLKLTGVDDPARGVPPDETAALGDPSERLTILLKHRPDVEDASLGRFDLQLSGHAHRGQIFPFNFLTGLKHPLQDGLHELRHGQYIYTSRGTGTWGPPMRILSPPEITLIELVAAAKTDPSTK